MLFLRKLTIALLETLGSSGNIFPATLGVSSSTRSPTPIDTMQPKNNARINHIHFNVASYGRGRPDISANQYMSYDGAVNHCEELPHPLSHPISVATTIVFLVST